MKKRKANDLTVTFKQRGGTHGSYEENASIAMQLRDAIRMAGNWRNLSPSQQLSLDEIVLKVARIVSGGANPKFAEHWHDIQGYAKLGEDACS